MRLNIFVILIAYLVDNIILVLIDNSFASNSFVFIPAIGFITTLLITSRMKKEDCFILSLISAMIYSILFSSFSLIIVITLCITFVIANLWAIHVSDTLAENVLLSMATLFIKEVILLVYFNSIADYSITISNWFIYRMILTLIINALLVIPITFVIRYKDNFEFVKNSNRKSKESITWWKTK